MQVAARGNLLFAQRQIGCGVSHFLYVLGLLMRRYWQVARVAARRGARSAGGGGARSALRYSTNFTGAHRAVHAATAATEGAPL